MTRARRPAVHSLLRIPGAGQGLFRRRYRVARRASLKGRPKPLHYSPRAGITAWALAFARDTGGGGLDVDADTRAMWRSSHLSTGARPPTYPWRKPGPLPPPVPCGAQRVVEGQVRTAPPFATNRHHGMGPGFRQGYGWWWWLTENASVSLADWLCSSTKHLASPSWNEDRDRRRKISRLGRIATGIYVGIADCRIKLAFSIRNPSL
jgi:hypothetical protein